MGQASEERAKGVALGHGVLVAAHDLQEARSMRVAERSPGAHILQQAHVGFTYTCIINTPCQRRKLALMDPSQAPGEREGRLVCEHQIISTPVTIC